MSIRARILALVGCFALTALIVAGLGLMTIGDYNRMMKTYDQAYDSAWRGERLNHLVSNVVMESRGIYAARNPAEMTGFIHNLNGDLDDMQAFLADWNRQVPERNRERLKPIAAEAATFIAVRRQLAQLAAAGKADEAERLGVGTRADRIAFQADLDGLVQSMLGDLGTAKAEAADFNRERAGNFLLAAAIGIAVMIGLSLWIVSRFITRPLRAVVAAIIRTSKGEYDAPFDSGDGKDEVAGVWQALRVLKAHAMEAERLTAAEQLRERELRQIMFD